MELPTTVEESTKHLKKMCQEIRQLVQDSKGARQQFLEDRAVEIAQSGNVSQHHKALEGLIKGEHDAEKWSKIRRALKPDTFGSITSLEVQESWPDSEQAFLSDDIEDPKKCLMWRTVDTPKEIEFHIHMRNRLHFGQA